MRTVVKTKTYYEILDVTPNASPAEIKKAFRSLALKFHPDKGGNNSEMFQLINEANEILSNENQRSMYDKKINVNQYPQYSQSQQPPPPPHPPHPPQHHHQQHYSNTYAYAYYPSQQHNQHPPPPPSQSYSSFNMRSSMYGYSYPAAPPQPTQNGYSNGHHPPGVPPFNHSSPSYNNSTNSNQYNTRSFYSSHSSYSNLNSANNWNDSQSNSSRYVQVPPQASQYKQQTANMRSFSSAGNNDNNKNENNQPTPPSSNRTPPGVAPLPTKPKTSATNSKIEIPPGAPDLPNNFKRQKMTSLDDDISDSWRKSNIKLQETTKNSKTNINNNNNNNNDNNNDNNNSNNSSSSTFSETEMKVPPNAKQIPRKTTTTTASSSSTGYATRTAAFNSKAPRKRTKIVHVGVGYSGRPSRTDQEDEHEINYVSSDVEPIKEDNSDRMMNDSDDEIVIEKKDEEMKEETGKRTRGRSMKQDNEEYDDVEDKNSVLNKSWESKLEKKRPGRKKGVKKAKVEVQQDDDSEDDIEVLNVEQFKSTKLNTPVQVKKEAEKEQDEGDSINDQLDNISLSIDMDLVSDLTKFNRQVTRVLNSKEPTIPQFDQNEETIEEFSQYLIKTLKAFNKFKMKLLVLMGKRVEILDKYLDSFVYNLNNSNVRLLKLWNDFDLNELKINRKLHSIENSISLSVESFRETSKRMES